MPETPETNNAKPETAPTPEAAAAPVAQPAPETAAQAAPAVKPAREKKKTYEGEWAATGRRKNAAARVRLLSPGTGKITVNGKPYDKYFTRETYHITIMQPLKLAKLIDKFDIVINAKGGGTTGQADAARHGIARAIIKFDTSLRSLIKKAGFLTRDPRAKERKKYGRKRARKRFQYSKR